MQLSQKSQYTHMPCILFDLCYPSFRGKTPTKFQWNELINAQCCQMKTPSIVKIHINQVNQYNKMYYG